MFNAKPRAACIASSVFALLIAFAGAPARAQIADVNLFRNISYQQTGNGNTTSLNGAFLSLSLFTENPGDFDTVSVSYPGPGSPVNLPQTASTTFGYETFLLVDQPTMDAQYPTGTYTFNASGGNQTSGSTSIVYSSDFYSSSMPYLTGTTFSSLQGVNGGNAIPVPFSVDNVPTGVSNPYIFFTVYNPATNATVYTQGFLDPSTTAVTIPAGTLANDVNYGYELDFSNRVDVASPGAEFEGQIGYDLRVDGNFSTVPAPDAILTSLLGFATAGSMALRRRARR